MNIKSYISSILFLLLSLSAFCQEHSNAESKDAKDKPDEFEILITYTDGTTETLRSEFYGDEVTGKPFIFKNNCERIYADQTKTIVIKNFKNDVQKGISYDNAWYFEVEGLTGPKLNVYNDRPYKQNVNNYYFRKGDGEFIKYSKSLIKTIFVDNVEAHKFAKKHLRAKFLQKTILYTGIVGAIGGAFVVHPAVSILGGIVISTSSYAYSNKINTSLYKAVMIYNQQW